MTSVRRKSIAEKIRHLYGSDANIPDSNLNEPENVDFSLTLQSMYLQNYQKSRCTKKLDMIDTSKILTTLHLSMCESLSLKYMNSYFSGFTAKKI